MKKVYLCICVFTLLSLTNCTEDIPVVGGDGTTTTDTSSNDNNSSEEDNALEQTCVTCAAFTTDNPLGGDPIEFPAQEVCKAENGNAIIDGEEFDVSYEITIQSMEFTTTCE